jgi:hypothetical protein
MSSTRMKLIARSAVTTRSVTDSATCSVSSAARLRAPPRSLVNAVPAALRLRCTSRRASRHAGNTATIMPATRETVAANASTCASSVTSLTRGSSTGAVRTNAASAPHATHTPSSPPASDNARCSNSACARAARARAERGSNRGLAQAAERAERQVGEVRAGDQQHRGDRAEQQPQSAPRLADDELFNGVTTPRAQPVHAPCVASAPI